MRLRILIRPAACVIAACVIMGHVSRADLPATPNIIFILADDLGFAEVGANRADNYTTPNIDLLAEQGIRFTRFYTAPLCGPSRALILTGRYAFSTGAVSQDACGSLIRTGAQAEVMVPMVLKQAGYTSGMVGKWGQILASGTAAEWGFDDTMSFRASGIYWTRPAAARRIEMYGLAGDKDGEQGVRGSPGPYTINEQKLLMTDDQYMPDIMHASAVDFVNAHKDSPFFLYYSLSQVHSQILPTPDSLPPDITASATARYNQIYADNVSYMDKLVGKLLDELTRLGLRENTVVFFMGDNGTAKANADRATIGGRRLIGQKGGMEEGGGLVPLIVCWPGVTPPGQVNANPADASDLLPTFAELAGAPVPQDRVIDGKSLVSQIQGGTDSPRTWAFTQLGGHWHLRDASWKLNEVGQLYDMRNAPFEEIPVPADSKETTALAARHRLSGALADLNPGAGFRGAGDGRSAKKQKPPGKSATRAK